MKRKPRIFRQAEGWIVAKPPYGFQQLSTLLGPFPRWKTALKAVEQWPGNGGEHSKAPTSIAMNRSDRRRRVRMSDHWTIADECSVCPKCGRELDNPAQKCPDCS